jgi:hypothetical protein
MAGAYAPKIKSAFSVYISSTYAAKPNEANFLECSTHVVFPPKK